MKKFKTYLVPFACALLVTVLVGAGVLKRVDKWVQDWLFQHPSVTSKDIVIIGIDDEAFDILGPYNTWDRNIIASALEALASDPEKKPAVTAIDVLYIGNTSQQADDRLAEAAADLGNVVTATVAEFGESVTWDENGHASSIDTSAVIGYEEPFDGLREVSVQGHINAMTDQDGILRHALLYVEPDGEKVYSMASQTARIFMEQRGEELQLPPVNSMGHFYVPFTGKPGAYYDGVSIAWLLQGKVPADYWSGKIVLIGPYAPALQDSYFTSINKGAPMYGVEFQANVIQSLIEGNFKAEAADLPQLVILFLLSFAVMVFFLRLKVLIGEAICAGSVIITFGASVLLYKLGLVVHPLWIPAGIIALNIIALALHYIKAAKERQALALEKERIGAELALATRIQANALPKEFPPFPDRNEFDVYASMTPAKEVGGDLYDFFMKDDDHLVLVIGDVSGKGFPAALFMMLAMTLIHHVAMHEDSPGKILTLVNEEICQRNPEEMFVTVWLGILEISTGKLTAANAGHEYPALKKPDEDFELLKDKHGFVIGGMEGVRYREYEVQLEPGTKIFVYTDGVAEATDSNEVLFGTDRMLEALRSVQDESPEGILDKVRSSVDAFVGKAPQFDDLTMLCLEYTGKE